MHEILVCVDSINLLRKYCFKMLKLGLKSLTFGPDFTIFGPEIKVEALIEDGEKKRLVKIAVLLIRFQSTT